MTLIEIQKAYKEYLMTLPVSKYEGQTINELIYRKQQDGRAVVLCLVDGLSILHAQWFYYDQVGNISAQVYEESFSDLKDWNDRIVVPIRIIEGAADNLDMFPKLPESSVSRLIQQFGEQNKQSISKYQEKLPQNIRNNYEDNYVVFQWVSGNITAERIMSIPKFVETMFYLQHQVRPEGYIVEQTVSGIFSILESKKWASSVQNTQIKYIQQNRDVKDVLLKQKGLIIDCYTLTVGINEQRKRELINQFIYNTVALKEKLLIICKDTWYTQQFQKAVQLHRTSMILQMYPSKYVQKQIQDGNFSVILWQAKNDQQSFQADAAFLSKIKFDTVLLCDHQKIVMQNYQFLQATKKILIATIVSNNQQNINMLTFLNSDLVQFADNNQATTSLAAFYEFGHHWDLNGQQIQQILQPEYIVQKIGNKFNEDVEAKKEYYVENKFKNVNYATDIKFKHYINQCSTQQFHNHIVLTINQTFEEKVRQRIFLDSDMIIQKILNDDKRGCGMAYDTKKQQGGKATFQVYQAAITYFFATLLQLQWLTNADMPQLNKSRTQILKMFLTSLIRLNKRSCLIVCPDTVTQPLIQAVKNIMGKKRYNLTTQLGQETSDDGLNIVVLSESQLQCLYIIAACYGRDIIPSSLELPRHIFFPCVSCRCCDVMVDAIYRVHGNNDYGLYQVCPLNSLEQHLFSYRQKFSFVLLQEQLTFYQAFTDTAQSSKLNDIDLYNQMLSFLKTNGFSGHNNLDYQVFSPEAQVIDEQLKQYLTHPQVQLVMSSHMHTDLILQAAWNDIFDIDQTKFNMKGFVAETYGRHDATLNINVKNQIYDSQGLINLDIHPDECISVDPGVLFYYNIQTNITFDIKEKDKVKSMSQNDDLKIQNYMQSLTLYQHFIQPNQNTSQMNVNEILQKLDSIRDSSTPSSQMKQFMQKINAAYEVGKAVKTCQDSSTTATKKRRPKQIVETPIMCSQTGPFREQAVLFSDYSAAPKRQATVCYTCLNRLINPDNSHQASQTTDRGLVFGPRCDFCDAIMKESYDLGQVEMLEQYQNQPIIAFKSVCPEKEFPRNAYENMTNMALNTFTYFGGQRIDSIYVTPKDILNEDDYNVIYEILQEPEFAEKPLHTIAAIVGLIKHENPTFPIQIRKNVKISNQLHSRQLKWLQIYMDWIIRNGYNQNYPSNDNQILYDNIYFERLIQFAVPYNLFDAFVGTQGMNHNVIQTAIAAQSLQQYAIKYMHQHLQQLQAQKYTEGFDYLQFIYQWYLQNPKQSLSQRYGPLGQGQFFKEFLQAIEVLPELRNSSIFNGCVVSNDSYVILALLSNITSLGSGFQGLKIIPQTLKMQKQVQYQPFQIIRAYRYHCRNASIHTPLYYLFQTEQSQQDFVSEYKKLSPQNQRYFVEQIVKVKFSPIQILSGPLDLAQQTNQSITKGDVPVPDRKQIQYIFDQINNLNVIKLHLHTGNVQHHQAQIQQFQQQAQSQSQIAQAHQSQTSNNHSMLNTSQGQTPSYNTNLNVSQGSGRLPQHIQTITGQYQPPMQPPPVYGQGATFQTPLVKTGPPAGSQAGEALRFVRPEQFGPPAVPEARRLDPVGRPPQNYGTGAHGHAYLLDQVIDMIQRQEASRKAPKLADITRRMMRHHLFRYYLMKDTLLYLPEVRVTDKPVEHYAAQLGLPLAQLQKEKVDFNCRFDDYVGQLCDDYIKLGENAWQWYKFLFLTETKKRAILALSSQNVKLNAFKKKLNKCQEWVWKHCLLSDCETQQKKIVYFAQDPVTGIEPGREEPMEGPGDPERYRKMPDALAALSPAEQERRYNALGKFILSSPRKDELIGLVAEHSFGLGSGPLEVFLQLQKRCTLDAHAIEVAAAIVQLMNLCKVCGIQFPFAILGKIDNQHFLEVYQHMEDLRLMQLKLQQIEYFVWLTRVQRAARDASDRVAVSTIQEHILDCTLGLEKDHRLKDMQTKGSLEEQKAAAALLERYGEAERLNRLVTKVDTLFGQFISARHPQYYQRNKQYPVPCFGINDASRTGLRELWTAATCYKLAFLAAFGFRYDTVETHVRDLARAGRPPIRGPDEAERTLAAIRAIYGGILDLWSRFHDYLLMFLHDDLGMTSSIAQLFGDRPEKSELATEDRLQKKVSILRAATMAHEVSGAQRWEIVEILREDVTARPPQGETELLREFGPLFKLLGLSMLPEAGPGQDGRLGEAGVRIICAFARRAEAAQKGLPKATGGIAAQLEARAALLRTALRTEWDLARRPVEEAMKMAGQAHGVSHGVAQSQGQAGVQGSAQGGFQGPGQGSSLSQIQAQGASQAPGGAYATGGAPGANSASISAGTPGGAPLGLKFLPPPPLAEQLPPPSLPQIPQGLPPAVLGAAPGLFAGRLPAALDLNSGSRGEPPSASGPPTTTGEAVPARKGGQSQYKIHFNHAPLEAKLSALQIQMINEKPLSFYKASREEVVAFIREVLKHSEKDVSSELRTEDDIVNFLFMVSSCQRQHTDEWGRLFSYIINTPPEPVEVGNERAKKAHEAISLFVQGHCGALLDGSRLFEKVNELQGALPEAAQAELQALVRAYVLHNMDIGYYNAFRYREEVGKQPDSVLNQYKIAIYSALKQMQILFGKPLNALIDEKNPVYRKKMGICTYFFLAQNAK